jgi:hypothetical protein
VNRKKKKGDQVMTLNLADMPQRSQMKLEARNSHKQLKKQEVD